MLRCNILSIFLAFSLLAGAQDWKVVRENSQKAFPKTVAAGNYSGIAHLHDDIYAVVSDKSDHRLAALSILQLLLNLLDVVFCRLDKIGFYR